jgi:hypothetical protein
MQDPEEDEKLGRQKTAENPEHVPRPKPFLPRKKGKPDYFGEETDDDVWGAIDFVRDEIKKGEES